MTIDVSLPGGLFAAFSTRCDRPLRSRSSNARRQRPSFLPFFALTAIFAVLMGFAAFLAVLFLTVVGRCSRAIKTSSLAVGLLCGPAYPPIFLIEREALQDDGFLTVIMPAFHAIGLLLAAVAGTVVRVRDRSRAVAR